MRLWSGGNQTLLTCPQSQDEREWPQVATGRFRLDTRKGIGFSGIGTGCPGNCGVIISGGVKKRVDVVHS